MHEMRRVGGIILVVAVVLAAGLREGRAADPDPAQCRPVHAGSLAPIDDLERQFVAMASDPSWSPATSEPKMAWRQPVRAAVFNAPGWFDAAFREHAQTLGCATGIDIAQTDAGWTEANLHVFFGTDAVVEGGVYPEATLVQPFCWAVRRSKCFAYWRPTYDRGSPGTDVGGASIYIDPTIPEEEQRRCLAATMTRAMGGGSADVLQQTAFRGSPYDYGDVPFSDRVTANDQVLLRALGDPRIDAFMTTREVAAVARSVLEDAVAGLSAVTGAPAQAPDPVRSADTPADGGGRHAFCMPSAASLSESFAVTAHGTWSKYDEHGPGREPLKRRTSADYYIDPAMSPREADEAARVIEGLARTAGIAAAPVSEPSDAAIAIIAAGRDESRASIAKRSGFPLDSIEDAARWACYSTADERDSEIGRALLVVETDWDPLITRACFYEELTWIFGMPPGDVSYRPSAFLRSERSSIDLSIGDKLLMRALYDPRLAPGMTPEETPSRVPEIMQDLVVRLRENGVSALFQR